MIECKLRALVIVLRRVGSCAQRVASGLRKLDANAVVAIFGTEWLIAPNTLNVRLPAREAPFQLLSRAQQSGCGIRAPGFLNLVGVGWEGDGRDDPQDQHYDHQFDQRKSVGF